MVSSKDIVKLLPQPEPFAAASRDEELSKWRSWSWQFEQYVCAFDAAFRDEFEHVREAKDPVSLPDMSEATKNRSTLLYALLTGLLHERGLQILKTVGSQNGFEAYRLINADLQPSARTRALALLQAINGWPQFAMQHGLTNQLAKLEDAELEYERITSTKLSDDHKMSVLLRCISGPLKQHTNLAVVEGTSYLNLVAMVKRWESSQSKWTVPINNMYQLGSTSSGHDTSGPMEVDMVQDKGGKKGKHKGKFTKGKGFGSDKGKGGKGETKFDGQQKGKQGKGQVHFGNGKGNYSNANANSVSSDACLYCGKRGHWKRDCHQRQRDQANKVQCVGDAAQAPVVSVSQHVTPSATNIPRPPASSAASTASSTLASATQYRSAQSSVRQVHYSLDDGCDWCDLTIYELESNPEIDISYTRMVQFSGHGNSCEFFDISCEDDVYHGGNDCRRVMVAFRRCDWPNLHGQQ